MSVVSDPLAAPLTSGPKSPGLSVEALLAGVYRGGPTISLRVATPDRQQRVTVQQAWAQLVGVMRTLCLPGGGWPAERPQTPENLLPYVGEEAEELLAALGQSPAMTEFRSQSPPSASAPDRLQSIQDLLPWILWGVASSRDAAMGWLEGRPAHITGTEGNGPGQRISGLRLVPCLRWHSTDGGQAWVLDVVTQSLGSARSPLANATTVSFLPGLSTVSSGGQLPDTPPSLTSVGDLIDQLWGAIARHHPPLAHLRQGWTVDLLLPGHDWLAGQLSLALVWVEVPLAATGGASLSVTPPESSPAALKPGEATVTAPPSLHSGLQWASPQLADLWLNQAIAQQMPRPWPIDSPRPDSGDALPALISITHQRAISAPPDLPIAHTSTGTEGQLAALWPWLRWWVLQTDPVVMALMAGVTCDCLSPEDDWQSGSLGLHLQLRLQGDVEVWVLNLLTGAWETQDSPAPSGLDSAVTLPIPLLDLPALTCLSAVQSRLHAHLQSLCPVMAALMAGTAAHIIHPSTGTDRLGVEARLDLAVVFQPHLPS
jgi:NTP pyrophosphatase (non-canonical NTP hydrolase)